MKATPKKKLLFEITYQITEAHLGKEMTFRVKAVEFDEQGNLFIPVEIDGSEGKVMFPAPLDGDYLRRMLNLTL